VTSALDPVQAQSNNSTSEKKSGIAMSTAPKSMQITLPIYESGFRIGEVIVQASSDGSVLIKRESFLAVIESHISKQVMIDLKGAFPANNFLDLDEISAAGIPTTYNPNNLQISIELTVEQRPHRQIRGRSRSSPGAPDVIGPAEISGFLNTHFGLAQQWTGNTDNSFEYPAILLAGALRWKNFVLEGEAELDYDGDFTRKATRLIYDFPEEAIRVSAGDMTLRSNGSFAMVPMLGIAIEKTYSTLQPTRNIRPSGKRSFRIERHSDVDVFVNGNLIRSLRLSPGEYDLRDLPLTTGTNDIQLKVRDEFGKEETIDFSILFNRTLLDPGTNEWSVSGGIRSGILSNSPYYAASDFMMSGVYRQGLLENVTGAISGQLSSSDALLGANALMQTSFGLMSLESSVSVHGGESLGWSLAGEFDFSSERLEEVLGSAHLGFDIASDDYLSGLEGMPNDGMRMSVNGSLSRALPKNMTANIAGYYAFGESNDYGGYGLSASLNRAVSEHVSIGISGSYEKQNESRPDKVNISARLNYRPNADSYVQFERDGLENNASLGFGSKYADEASRTSVDVELAQAPGYPGERLQKHINIDAYHKNSRFEANASHARRFQGLGSPMLSWRSSLNVGTSIAFADDVIAWGPPVHSGFALVSTHPSLSESKLKIDPASGTARAVDDGLGPLLVSDISAYVPTTIPYDFDSLPPGYDLGSSAMNFFAPYRAGFNVTIGSEYSVTAVGVLKDQRNQPLSLKVGSVSLAGNPKDTKQIFTNSSGRFAIQGLKPGQWWIRLNDLPDLKHEIVIDQAASGLVNLGTIEIEVN